MSGALHEQPPPEHQADQLASVASSRPHSEGPFRTALVQLLQSVPGTAVPSNFVDTPGDPQVFDPEDSQGSDRARR